MEFYLNHHMNSLHGLYAITPEYFSDYKLMAQVEFALQGGARLVQYRNKEQSGVKQKTVAEALLNLCRAYQIPLIINDNVELAYSIAADGVHLGCNDLDPSIARQKLGQQAIIGVSCYDNLDLAMQAQAMGANYVAFGSFFPSITKPHATRASLELLHQAKSVLSLPIVAIGGITCNNGKVLINAGADMLAVVDGLFASEDTKMAALCLSQLWATKFSI